MSLALEELAFEIPLERRLPGLPTEEDNPRYGGSKLRFYLVGVQERPKQVMAKYIGSFDINPEHYLESIHDTDLYPERSSYLELCVLYNTGPVTQFDGRITGNFACGIFSPIESYWDFLGNCDVQLNEHNGIHYASVHPSLFPISFPSFDNTRQVDKSFIFPSMRNQPLAQDQLNHIIPMLREIIEKHKGLSGEKNRSEWYTVSFPLIQKVYNFFMKGFSQDLEGYSPIDSSVIHSDHSELPVKIVGRKVEQTQTIDVQCTYNRVMREVKWPRLEAYAAKSKQVAAYAFAPKDVMERYLTTDESQRLQFAHFVAALGVLPFVVNPSNLSLFDVLYSTPIADCLFRYVGDKRGINQGIIGAGYSGIRHLRDKLTSHFNFV